MNLRRKETNNHYNVVKFTNHDGSEMSVLESPKLKNAEGISHFFTTREGGVSTDYRGSLNLGAKNDERENVIENFTRVADALGADLYDIVCTQQEHTTNVVRVGWDDAGRGLKKGFAFSEVDGLITNEKGLVISAYMADCTPILLYDPVNEAIGAVHSGWRGTVGRIGGIAVSAMTREFGTNPDDLICAIGPSICRDCYEVSGDVAEKFMKEFPNHVDEILIDRGFDNKYLLDLWATNKIILMEAGVPEAQIDVTDICTCCNPEALFSHRASHGKRGIMGAFIMLK